MKNGTKASTRVEKEATKNSNARKKTKTEVKESTRIFPPHLVICNKAMLQKNTMTDVKESTCIFPLTHHTCSFSHS